MIFEYLKTPRLVTDAILAFLILGYILIGWNWIVKQQPALEPGQGKEESIVNPIVHVGEPLELSIATTVDQSLCNVISERHIINSEGKDVYSNWKVIPNQFLVEMRDGVTIHLKVPLPNLEPGHYFYISNIHLSCPGGQSYLRSTDHLTFEIIP